MFNQTKSFVNGEWKDSTTNDTFEVRNPFNDELIDQVADCGKEDALIAIDHASKAFQSWRNTTPKFRSGYLRKIGDLLLEHKEELASLMTKEQGKPLNESRGEVAFSAGFFHFFSEECKRPDGEMIPSAAGGKQYMTLREPLGVAAMVLPWNFPIGMPARKVAAAMAAGCTCVVKPAEDTPLISLAFAKIVQMADVPAGVVNIIPCSRDKVREVGEQFCESPKVAVLSFTGSTDVGKYLYSLCGKSVKRVALELGGNAPFIVFKSADIDLAVQGLMASKYRNSGQTCVTANRILVHKDIYAEFLEKFKETSSKEKVGNGAEAGTTQGPIINEKQLNRVVRIVAESLSQGAFLEMGGKTEGRCYLPTILTNVTPDMTCWKEEIFGPVAAIASFEDEDEAVRLANDSDRGLAGFFFSRDYSQIWRVAKALEMGMVGINDVGISTPETPFGGYKTSGIGKEGSRLGLDEYSNVKLIDMGGL